MPHRGQILRRFREAWGLTTREVEAKSRLIAQHWGDDSYLIDSSYVTKIETGQQPLLTVALGKAVSMTEILSKGSNTLLNLCRPPRNLSLVEDFLGGPESTQRIREGRLAEAFSYMLTAAYPEGPVPQTTTLSYLPELGRAPQAHPFQNTKRYIRAIVGKADLCLSPYIVPGTFLIVDRKSTTIPTDKDYDNELQRPVFVVDTHDGYFCCWCDLIGNGDMVKIVQHPLGALPNRSLLNPLKLGQQVEIVGEVAFTGVDRRQYLKRRIV